MFRPGWGCSAMSVNRPTYPCLSSGLPDCLTAAAGCGWSYNEQVGARAGGVQGGSRCDGLPRHDIFRYRDRGSSFFDTKTKHNRESTNRQAPPASLHPVSLQPQPTATVRPLTSCTPHPITPTTTQQRNATTTKQRTETADQHNTNSCYCYCYCYCFYCCCCCYQT